MTKQLKPWDAYVEEAQREPLELPMPDGEEPILIGFPTGGQIRRLQRAWQAGDNDEAVFAMFGDEQGKRLLALFEDAPGDVVNRIVTDVAKEFGVDPSTGNPLASSS